MEHKNTVPISLPVVVSREGKWFVAADPLLEIATQGKTEKEVRENMQDLIADYFQDPDTPKPTLKMMMSTSVSVINMPVKVGITSAKASTIKAR
ncbi:type II toxin-antitoxin system HicB family antitoxin [Candidatus Micrarchaeota archaeon]|nr:type II toxin-antitoxin system HicB family antitoxin [Candidatus Micrarchaeota archaeon]